MKFNKEDEGKKIVKVKSHLYGDGRKDGSYVGTIMTLLKVKDTFIEVSHPDYGKLIFSRVKGEMGEDDNWSLYE